MISPYYRKIFEEAISQGECKIKGFNADHVQRMRQRLYRIRTKLKEEPTDPLALLVDDLKFNIDGKELIIVYSNLEDIEAIKRSLQ